MLFHTYTDDHDALFDMTEINWSEIRLNVCIAAKKHVQRELTMLWEDSWSEMDQCGLYNIKYPDRRVKTEVEAVSCPSSPKIYVYVREATGKFVAVFVEPRKKIDSYKIISRL